MQYEAIPEIPAGNWLVKVDQMTGEFYLELQEAFTLPEKVYGNVMNQVDRYLNTFNSKSSNLGILLKGLKGTGKSLTAKAICINSGLPVILITAPYKGPTFESFLAGIKQECIVFIDEFEKIYSSGRGDNSQKNLLSILDGVFESKKLFLLTANNQWGIDDAMINRPGRIHYLREYKGLSKGVIEEIVDDNLKNPAYKDEMMEVCQILGEVNMDSLLTLIGEVNMYDETPKEAIKHLNITIGKSDYSVTWVDKDYPNSLERMRLKAEGKPEETEVLRKYSATINHHPLMHSEIEMYGRDRESGRSNSVYLTLDECDVKTEGDNIYVKHGSITYTFEKKSAYTYVF